MAAGRLTRGERNIAWIERHCRVPEGKLVGRPVRLRPWQRAEIRKIYDNPAGTRRAILSFGRKNGKTALSAFLLLLHLVGLSIGSQTAPQIGAQKGPPLSILLFVPQRSPSFRPGPYMR